MSHWTRAKVKIANPNAVILRSALEVLAKELNGVVAENVTVHGYSRSQQCRYAVLCPLRYGNGYGIVITDQGLQVVVDDHGAPMTAREFADRLTQLYTAIALVTAAQNLGFQTSVQEEKGRLVVDLVRW